MIEIHLESSGRSEMIDITDKISSNIPNDFNGACCLISSHTTAGLTINENADSDVQHDILKSLERIFPWNDRVYRHMEGNSAAHLKSSFVGSSEYIPVENGILKLGTWQGIYFCEFDGPRRRKVLMQLIKN